MTQTSAILNTNIAEKRLMTQISAISNNQAKRIQIKNEELNKIPELSTRVPIIVGKLRMRTKDSPVPTKIKTEDFIDSKRVLRID